MAIQDKINRIIGRYIVPLALIGLFLEGLAFVAMAGTSYLLGKGLYKLSTSDSPTIKQSTNTALALTAGASVLLIFKKLRQRAQKRKERAQYLKSFYGELFDHFKENAALQASSGVLLIKDKPDAIDDENAMDFQEEQSPLEVKKERIEDKAEVVKLKKNPALLQQFEASKPTAGLIRQTTQEWLDENVVRVMDLDNFDDDVDTNKRKAKMKNGCCTIN